MSDQRGAPQVLLGDLGGTNVRFTLVPASRTGGTLPPETHHARYRTASFAHLREALAKFRREAPTDVGRIVCGVLSVCGPVNDGRAICLAESMGASGWTLEEADLGTNRAELEERLLVRVEKARPEARPPGSYRLL